MIQIFINGSTRRARFLMQGASRLIRGTMLENDVILMLEAEMAETQSALIEALRRARAKAAFCLEPGRDYHKGLQEIAAILEDVTLGPTPTATLVPEVDLEEVAPAAPLSR